MEKVRITATVITPAGETFVPGEVVDLDEAYAATLVRKRLAVACDAEPLADTPEEAAGDEDDGDADKPAKPRRSRKAAGAG